MVQLSALPAPTAPAIIAANHSFPMTANVTVNTPINGLTELSNYVVYVIARDNAGTSTTNVNSVSFTTL